ncbi:MAG: 50S ribosomal protein L6 [bacterium]
MSRIGKLPITIPEKVTCKIEQDEFIVSGPKGELTTKIPNGAEVKIDDKNIIVELKKDEGNNAIWGLTRSLINNSVIGVSEGFEKKLIIEGVGYRAVMKGKILELSVGFSHSVEYNPPEGVEIKVEKEFIIVSGRDKQMVGQAAAEIRKVKKPEPYKGKGIRYEDEHVRRKIGKRATGTEGE